MEETSKKTGSLTNQSAWILFAKIAGFALNTILPLLVVRYLTQENVGVYRQAFLVAANAVLVLPLGFSMSAYYFLNREPEKHPAAIFNILVFNFAMGAAAFLVLFFFPQILGVTFQSPELTRLAPLIGIAIWLWIFSGFLETAALALQQARLAAVFIVLSQLLKTAFMITAVVFFNSVDSLLYAAIALFSIQSVVLAAFLHRRFPNLWSSIDPPFFRKQLAYALPYGLSMILYVGQTDIHNYFVSHSFSAAEFAIYSVGCFQLPLIAMLYESVGAVMIPRISQLQDEGKKREILELTAAATQKLSFFYFPLFAFLMIVANEFITTLFTKDYAASAAIFQINLLALPLFSLAADPIARAYPFAGKFLLKVRVAICIVLFAIFFIGLGRFGLIEMISIVVAAMLVEKVACGWISMRMLDAKGGDIKLFAAVGKIAIASLAAAAVLAGFYVLAAGRLTEASDAISRLVLDTVNLTNATDFLSGCIFLSVCAAVYAAAYLIAANWLGAIASGDKEKFFKLARKILPRRGVETKTA